MSVDTFMSNRVLITRGELYEHMRSEEIPIMNKNYKEINNIEGAGCVIISFSVAINITLIIIPLLPMIGGLVQDIIRGHVTGAQYDAIGACIIFSPTITGLVIASPLWITGAIRRGCHEKEPIDQTEVTQALLGGKDELTRQAEAIIKYAQENSLEARERKFQEDAQQKANALRLRAQKI